MTPTNSTDVCRRGFMTWCASAGVATTLFPGALWAASAGASVEMIDKAARLAGLEFTVAEREQMLVSLHKILDDIRGLRALNIVQSVSPPLYFNPVVPGQRFDTPAKPFVLGPQVPMACPARLEDVHSGLSPIWRR
ncbi:MAG: hypothetical protein AB8B57_07475 [Congregibacter sp.]